VPSPKTNWADIPSTSTNTNHPNHIKARQMKKIIEIFKGDKGEFSSKRFVGIIGAFVLFGTMAHNSMSSQDIAPSPDLVEAVKWIVIMSLGFTSIDKFSKQNEN
jgi:hypothetical protein